MTAAIQSTLTIVLSSPRTQAQLGPFVKDASNNRLECTAIEHLFRRLNGGLESGSFQVTTSASAPVQASGTVTVVNGSVTANDTVTIGATVLTAKTSGAVGPQFNIGASGTITAANLAAAINANCPVASATSAAAVVTVTCNVPGIVGNWVPMATSHTAAFTLSAATLASGAGGAETTPVTYNKGR
jgi:hypothetical protein